MSVVRQLRLKASPQQVIAAIDAQIGRSSEAFLDFREADGKTVGLAMYEQYFMRASNRVALAVMADNFAPDGSTLVRVIVTGSSQGLFINFDWGAAGDYASEAVRIISDLAEGCGGLLPPGDYRGPGSA